MFLKILLVLVVLAALVLAFASFQPNEFRVERSMTISAPAPVVFALVNDFHNWVNWSPWEKIDPAMTRTYEGSASGVGAIYRWAGNNKVGEGNMTIVESHPSDLIRMRLQFLKPFAATNASEFTFKPEGNQTTVTWSMSGKNVLLAKIFHLFMNMDKMIGGSFEQGLAQMKSVAETASK
jgi:hypothetical protein